MQNTLKLQIALLTVMTFAVGFASGIYIASVMIGNWIPELSR